MAKVDSAGLSQGDQWRKAVDRPITSHAIERQGHRSQTAVEGTATQPPKSGLATCPKLPAEYVGQSVALMARHWQWGAK